MTPAELPKKNLNSKCQKSAKWSLWHSSHLDNGNLKPNTLSRDSKEDASNSAAVTFNMVHTRQSPEPSDMNDISFDTGPLLDDRGPYSRIGENEFHLLHSQLHTNFSGSFHEQPEAIVHRPYWQYGSGSHSSQSMRIIGSVLINLLTDQVNAVRVRHFIIDRSSYWIIGRNLTKICNVSRCNANKLELATTSSTPSPEFSANGTTNIGVILQ